MPDSRRVFEQITKQQQQGRQPRAIFDLDNTLFEVTPRSQKILQRVLANLQSSAQNSPLANKKSPKQPTQGPAWGLQKEANKWSQECQVLSQLRLEITDWGIEPLRQRAAQQLGRDLDDEFWRLLFKKWRQLFFSNEFLRYDEPYRGAVEYVQKLHAQGVRVSYLTGRNQKNMCAGTVASLQQRGFPLDEGAANLFLKPKSHYKDDEFKARFLEQLPQPHSELWFFENEALILQVAGQRVPDINLVFMNTTHSGRAPEPTHLLQISSFNI